MQLGQNKKGSGNLFSNKVKLPSVGVPLAETVMLPQIFFDYYSECGIEKELRMYSENDQDLPIFR